MKSIKTIVASFLLLFASILSFATKINSDSLSNSEGDQVSTAASYGKFSIEKRTIDLSPYVAVFPWNAFPDFSYIIFGWTDLEVKVSCIFND